MINGVIVSITMAVILCLIIIMIITIFISSSRYQANQNVSILEGSLGQSCYYNKCAPSLSCDGSSFTCKNNISLSCDQGSDCITGVCSSEICSNGSGPNPPLPNGQLGSSCVTASCIGNILTCNTLGSNNQNICLYVDNQACTINLDCDSFNCSNSICTIGTPNGYPCSGNSDCQSVNCSNSICQRTGIVTGVEGSSCVTDLYGGGNNYVNTSCNTGFTCSGTQSNLVAGTCKSLNNFMEVCTQASDCSVQFDCTTSYAEGINKYCLLHYDNPMDIATNKVCPSPFTPSNSSDLISCLGPTNYSCNVNADCASGTCSSNYGTSILYYDYSQMIVPSLNNLKGSFSLKVQNFPIDNSIISFDYNNHPIPTYINAVPSIVNYSYGSTGAYILYQTLITYVIDLSTVQISCNLEWRSLISGSTSGKVTIANNDGNSNFFNINIIHSGIYQNLLLCLMFMYEGLFIIQVPLSISGIQSIKSNSNGIVDIYTQFYIDTTGTTTNYILTTENSILAGVLDLDSSTDTITEVQSYGNLTPIYSTGYIYGGATAISTVNGVPYVFYTISTGLRIIDVTTNTPLVSLSVSINSAQYPFTIYNFSPYFSNGIIGVYAVINNSENVSFTTLLDIWDTTLTPPGLNINTWNLPGNVSTETAVFVVGNNLMYLTTDICS